MKINENFNSAMTPYRLSILWIFIMLNVVFRDFHDLFIPEFFQQISEGVINGQQISAKLLLFGSMMIEIPIAMIVLSILLPEKISRIMNLAVGLLAIPLLFQAGIRDLDDYFFSAVELAAVATILYTAWKWKAHPSPSLALA